MDKNHQALEEALALLNQKHNEIFASQLTTEVDAAVSRITGELVARVETAVSLTDEEKLKLQQIISDLFGKSLTVEFKQNRTLLGGFKVLVGDWKFDATLFTQLKDMRQSLRGNHG